MKDIAALKSFCRAASPIEASFPVYPLTGELMLDAYCRTLIMVNLQSRRANFPSLNYGLRSLRELLSNDTVLENPAIRKAPALYHNFVYRSALGRCFFRTKNGNIGLAPSGTRIGDTVCVRRRTTGRLFPRMKDGLET